MSTGRESFDFVIVGAGAAGEAALTLARERGATAAIIEDDLFGGSCAFWACMPSKALLHAAAVHHRGGDFPWARASDFRDWMINREGIDVPDDSSHETGYRDKGAEPIRGRAHLAGPGRVGVEVQGGGRRELAARHIVLAVGSRSRIPPIVGLDQVRFWTNREGTSARSLPESLLIMGGGPTGVELAQVYARYGVPVTIIDSNDRLLARDHPRSSEFIRRALERDGATVRTGVRAVRVQSGGDAVAPLQISLSDGSTAEGHEVLVAIGREIPTEGLGLETLGLDAADGFPRPDDQLRIAPDVYVAGDPAGPELHTHLAHYQGEMAVRIALGDQVKPDYRAIPRATYTDPEAASVGMQLEEALAAGRDAFDATADVATSAKGFVTESEGHVTIVLDRKERVLLGAFIAGPAASETIHEAVLAVKTATPLHVLADTIHAFPTLARVMGGLFMQVNNELERITRPASADRSQAG
jgi:dihydrolipoamide dehydrogenase